MLVEHFGDFQKSEQNQTFQRLVLARSEKRKKSLEYIRNRRKMLNVRAACMAADDGSLAPSRSP